MLKRIKNQLLKLGVDLQEHKLILPTYKRNKYAKYMYGAFGLIFLIYLVDLFTKMNLGINGLFVYVALTLLVLYPIATRQDNPYELLILTKVGLIKKINRKEFLIMSYSDITKFRQDDHAVYLFQNREQMTLERHLYSEILPILIDILEAKGKTFDKEKDYMIRDIIIHFDGDNIKIEEVLQEETETQKITEKLFRDYPHLTPGYIEEVIPKNAIIYDVIFDGPHLHMLCSRFDIKGNHPENITFDNIVVNDAILIFESAEILGFSARETNERSAPFHKVEINKENLVKYLKDSVIDDWRYDVKSIFLENKAGLGNVRIRIKYSEVLIGWKKEE